MVDKVAIFTDLTRRNALRREAKLPLLDVQTEFVHAVEVATWREACKEQAEGIVRIREQAEADFRQRHCGDGGLSAGGRWAMLSAAGLIACVFIGPEHPVWIILARLTNSTVKVFPDYA